MTLEFASFWNILVLSQWQKLTIESVEGDYSITVLKRGFYLMEASNILLAKNYGFYSRKYGIGVFWPTPSSFWKLTETVQDLFLVTKLPTNGVRNNSSNYKVI